MTPTAQKIYDALRDYPGGATLCSITEDVGLPNWRSSTVLNLLKRYDHVFEKTGQTTIHPTNRCVQPIWKVKGSV